MPKLLKWTAFAVVGVVIALLALALILTRVIDPNDYKPQLINLAAEQGVDLRLDGSMAWQFFPQLAISVEQVAVNSVRSKNAQKPLLQLDKVFASVQVKPLLQRQVKIDGISLDGARIRLTIDKQGQGNWQELLIDSTTKQTAPAEPANQQPEGHPGTAPLLDLGQLSLATLSLQNSELQLIDHQSQQHLALTDINVEAKDVNLANRAFPLSLGVTLQQYDWHKRQPALSLAAAFKSEIAVADNLSHLSLNNGAITLKLDQQELRLALQMQANNSPLGEQPSQWHYQGDLELVPLNLSRWLEALGQTLPPMQSPEALSKLAFRAHLNGNQQQVQLTGMELQLDQTKITGQAAITDFNSANFDVQLAGDQINVDHYLPPPAPATSVAPQAPPAASSSAAQAPLFELEPLRSLNGQTQLTFEQVIASGLVFNNNRLHFSARQGLLTLEELHTDFYDGTIDAKAHLNAKGNTAVINGQADIAGVQLAGILKALQRQEQLTGALNAKLNAKTRGLSADALFQQLTAQMTVDAQQLKLADFNLEQQFCTIATQLGNQPAAATEWPAYTQLQDVKADISLQQGVATIKQLSAGVENLQLGSRGQVDLNQQRFDLQLPMTLSGEVSSEQGCQVKSQFLRNRELALVRCRGSLATPAPGKDCGIDQKAFRQLSRDYAEYKVSKKVAKEKDRLLEKATEKLGTGTADLLKGLFK